jgi:CPA1 family monovalent cation:H+ antiporter
LPQRNLLLTLTFGIVLFTILAQGLTMRPLLERLGVGGEEGSQRDVDLILGRLRTIEAAGREVASLRRAHALDEHLARRLLERYVARRQELLERLDMVYHSSEALERQQEVEVLRHLWRVQREAARAGHVGGQLSRGALRELIAEIDEEMGHLDGVGGKARDVDAGR